MINQFEDYPYVLLNGRPVLEFYDITESKWAALGYESLFFIFFFMAAWAVSTPGMPLADPCTGPQTQRG